MQKSEFNTKVPYFFKDIKDVLKKNGTLRQNKKLINIIKKNHSVKIIGCGIPKYYMRVDSFQMSRNTNEPAVLVAVPDLKGGFNVKFLES